MATEDRIEVAEAVRGQAGESLKELLESATRALAEVDVSSTPPEVQTQVVRAQLALLATVFPLASLGTCDQDGTELLFRGRDDGLYVCCVHGHCWKVS